MSVPTNEFQFGHQTISTRVNIMVPRNGEVRPLVNITDAMDERPRARSVSLTVAPAADPFAEVEV